MVMWTNTHSAVFEPGRDFATLSRFLFECRTKINHPRHHVAKNMKCRVSELGTGRLCVISNTCAC